MEKKTKIIFIISFVLIILVVMITFYKFFILHNYKVSLEVPCDPKIESCFVYECDPAIDEECSEEDPNIYYKLIEKKAFKLLKCQSDDSQCLLCDEDDLDCVVTLCDPSIVSNICSVKNNEKI